MVGEEVDSVNILIAVWLLKKTLFSTLHLLILPYVISPLSFSVCSTASKRPGTLEKLRNLNLHITEIPLPRRPLPLLLPGIITLRCPRWTAFESTVPVVRYEGLAFVFLGGAVGVYVVDVGEVGMVSARHAGQLGLGEGEQGKGGHALFFTQRNHLINIKQPLSPRLQIRWIRHKR